MGHHYVPRYYLRGFLPNFGKKVWTYDKKEKRKFYSNVVNVGQENSLYTDELEAILAQGIEEPANGVLDKIKHRQYITPEDKAALSLYLTTFWKRVPAGKNRLNKRMPGVISEVRSGIHSEIDQIVSEEPKFAEDALRIKSEVDEIIARARENPPDSIWHQVMLPESTPRLAEQISNMTWVFFYSQDSTAFLTCDNPVFFFEQLGICNQKSELSVPICGESSLWATNRRDIAPGYHLASKAVVNELNRRTARNSTRFVFAGIDHPWIERFVFKGHWQVTRIV